MGYLSLFLLTSFPFLVLGNYPFTAFTAFSAFNKPEVKTYHETPAPAYHTYNNVPSYRVTPYSQQKQFQYKSEPKVSVIENVPEYVPYPSPTTTATVPSPQVKAERYPYQLADAFTSSNQPGSNTFIYSAQNYQKNRPVHLNDVTSNNQLIPIKYELPSKNNILENLPVEIPKVTTTTTSTTSAPTFKKEQKLTIRSQSSIDNIYTDSQQTPDSIFQSSSQNERTNDDVQSYDVTSYDKHTQVQYESAPKIDILRSIPLPIWTPSPKTTTTNLAPKFENYNERLGKSLYPHSNEISSSTQPEEHIFLPHLYSTEPPTTTAVAILPPTFEDNYGYKLAEKTRQEANTLILYLSQLDQNKEASNLIRANIESNACLDSLKDMMDLLEGGTRVIESSGPELEDMITTLNGLRNERNITLLVRGAAALLIQLDNVLPKMATFTFLRRCSSSSSERLQSLRDQAQILYSLSFVADFKFTQAIKDNLFQSAIITEAVTNFLDHLGDNLARQDCFTQNDFLGEGTLLAAQIMDDLAEVLGVLGFFPSAREARQYALFTRSIAANLGNLKQFRIPDDCSPGALLRGAGYLTDLANLIDEVGLLELGINLGLVFRLDLLP